MPSVMAAGASANTRTEERVNRQPDSCYAASLKIPSLAGNRGSMPVIKGPRHVSLTLAWNQVWWRVVIRYVYRRQFVCKVFVVCFVYTMGTRSFPLVERLGLVVDQPPLSRVEVKERVELYDYSPSGLSGTVSGQTLLYCTCLNGF